MLIIRNSIIPFKGYKLMTVWPLMFVRKGKTITARDMNHERIHAEQQKELLIVLFYVLYLAEWIVRLCMYCDWNMAYRNISFEREAYGNEWDGGYLEERRRWGFWRFF